MSSTIRTSIAVIVVATAAGVAGYLANRGEVTSLPAPPAPSAEAVDRLSRLKLPDLEGREQSLEQWHGKVLVINFWATWCPPCRAEIPEFAVISKEFAFKETQFVGISMDDADKVRQFKREFEVPYPILIGNPGLIPLITDLGNQANGLPFTVILRRDGRLHQVKLGAMQGPELKKILTDALAEH